MILRKLIALLWSYISVVNRFNVQLNDVSRALISVDGFVDPEACYTAIEESISKNKDGDRKMNQEDYVEFVQAYGPIGFLDDATVFKELPLILQSTFYYIACLCKIDPKDESCCKGSNAGIDTSGSFSEETPTVAEQSYLFLVCSQTSTSIDRVIQSTAPSQAPILLSTVPSAAPTLDVSAPSTVTGSLSPTWNSGNDTTTREDVSITYSIGIQGKATFDEYNEELISAMDSLAPEVLQEIRRRRLRVGRRLQSVQLPTSIANHTLIDCPLKFNISGDSCENITASIILLFQPSEPNRNEVVATFQETLSMAIWNGQLEEFLTSDTVYILDKNAIPPDDNTPGDGSQVGNITIAVIGSLVVIAAAAFFVTRRRGSDTDESSELHPVNVNNLALDKGPGDDAQKITQNVGSAEVDISSTVKKKTVAVDDVDPENLDINRVDDLSIAGEMSSIENGDASSSNAGSSGWSSSAGIDSMNTDSADGLDFEKSPIASIGSTHLPLVDDQTRFCKIERPVVTNNSPNIPSVTRDDLDSAIEAGDWAAVGATAALLAATSDSQSFSSKSEQHTGTRSISGSSVSSLDVARAAELDHLVDAGDWEGVVLAAAKYEGDESKESLPSASISGSESRSNPDTAVADSSISSSKGLKRKEYRVTVEDLVRRVVPEEIQNVDEMMLQFRGREDELIETLRTMQERAVAQKARHSSQRAAKQQAKLISATAKTEAEPNLHANKSKSIGIGFVSSVPTVKSLGTGEIGITKSTGKNNQPAKQSALEDAIYAGDWDAVGAAATLLKDSTSKVSAPSSDEINQFSDEISTDDSSVAESNDLAEVADELQELIDSGDWNGVVRAAGAAKSDEQKAESNESKRIRRLKHLHDEQEALAQAEIWSAIAEQSKQEAETTDQNAASAAQWAIDRSLNALVEAELNGINDQSTVGTDGDSTSRERRKDDYDDESGGNEV